MNLNFNIIFQKSENMVVFLLSHLFTPSSVGIAMVRLGYVRLGWVRLEYIHPSWHCLTVPAEL